MNDLHGIIFAYRANPELRELTQHRNTCSIPYGGRYRVIDFMLSNLVNAGVDDIGLIVHQSYQSLLDHLGSGKDWDASRKRGGLRILPPFSYAQNNSSMSGFFKGRMDALAGVYSYLENIRQDYVVLATGALAINFPLKEMFQAHLTSGADVTALCTHEPKCDPKGTNYFTIGKDGFVSDVTVHPAVPSGVEALDVYIMSKDLLMSIVDHCSTHNIYSFSHGVLLGMLGKLTIKPYFYDGYAARLQSVPGYFTKSMELLDPKVRADLFVPERPVETKNIEGEVINSILSRSVHIAKGARVENCILLQRTDVQEGAVLRYVITDKNVRVNPGRMLMGHETYPMAVAKNEIV